MNKRRLERIFWVFIIGLLSGLNIYTYLSNPRKAYLKVIDPFFTKTSSSNINQQSLQVSKNLLPYYQLFNDSVNYLRYNYINNTHLDYKTMFMKAIDGLYQGVNDPYTTFLDSSFFQDISNDIGGEIGGIGLYLEKNKSQLKVISIIPNTPSYKAGIHMGDIITKIDRQNTADLDIDTATEMIQGKINTKIKLQIYRPADQKWLNLQLKRASVKINSTYSCMINKNIGYLKIIRFSDIAPQEVSGGLKKLVKNHMKALVLDLRNNPGGSLQASVEIANMFIEKGLIVEIKGSNPENNAIFYADPKKLLLSKKTKMAVLVNKESASAAEILSGTLKDYKRATIIGETTFGKGAVQSIFPIKFGKQEVGFKITVANYYTPGGYTIAHKGISPNIKVILPSPTDEIAKNIDQLVNTKLLSKLLGNKLKEPLNEENYDRLKKDLVLQGINIPDLFLKKVIHEQRDLENGQINSIDIHYDSQLKKAMEILHQ